MVVFDDTLPWAEKLKLYQHSIQWQGGRVPSADRVEGEKVEVPQSEPLRNECSHFLSCCLQRSQPRTDSVEGLQVLRVLAMAQKSLEEEGRSIRPQDLSAPNKPAYFAHPTALVDDGAEIGVGTKIWHFSHVSSVRN